MLLHLGGEYSVYLSEVIVILDLESSLKSQDTRTYLNLAGDEKKVINIIKKSRAGKQIEKSIIITQDRVYLSPISSFTLQKRAHRKKAGTGEKIYN